MRPEFEPGSTIFGPEDWRNRRKMNAMSISELVSELRDTFIPTDFNIVEETLVSREAILKAEIEEKKTEIEDKKAEIGLLTERMEFEKLERLTVELQLKKIKEEMALLKKNGNGSVAKGGLRCDVDAVKKNRVVVAEMHGEKIGVLVKEKKGDDEQRKKDDASEQRLGIGIINDIGDNIKLQSSSGVVKKNLTTRLTKPIEITPRDNFDQVDETLVFSEAMLKAAVEEKVGKLQENNQFKSWGRLNFEIEVKTATGERRGEEFVKVGETGNGFGLDDVKVLKTGVGHEKCKFEVLKNRGVGDGEACAIAELESENVEVLAKTLMVREAMLKSAVQEKVVELQEDNQFKRWGRLNFEIEVKAATGERRGEEFVKVGETGNWFGLDDVKVLKTGVGHENCKFEVLKNRGVGDGEAYACAELVSEQVEGLAKRKRFVSEPDKKGGLGDSDTEQQSSTGAVQKNFATSLPKPIAIPPSEAMLKAAIEEKMRSLQKKNQLKSSGRLNFDVEGETVNEESCGEKLVKVGKNGNAFELDVGKVVKVEACDVAELKNQKVEVLAEKKRLAGEPSKKVGLASSGNERKNSSGAFQKNLATTKLAEPIRTLKRDFPSTCGLVPNMNIFDVSDSDSSSSGSSSSSSEFDMDIAPLISISNKKMRTNASQPTNGILTKLTNGK